MGLGCARQREAARLLGKYNLPAISKPVRCALCGTHGTHTILSCSSPYGILRTGTGEFAITITGATHNHNRINRVDIE